MKRISVILVAISIVLFASCSRPFDVPEFVGIGTNETAFIVPLTGDTSKQGQFMSEDYLRKNMVATKRVQIPHEWVRTGKRQNDGKYLPTIAVIKVNRTPVSVTWSDNPNVKIGVESKESIGFTVPISLTAMIETDETPKFLAKYTPNKSLSDVVDSDVNAFVRTEAASRFGVYSLEECKARKKEIIAAIFDGTKTFFKQYGITISQFGMTDGFLYDKKEIQDAIDRQAIEQALGKELDEKKLNTIKQNSIDLSIAQNAALVAREKSNTVSTLKALQEVENSKILAEAQADAIREFGKNANLPDVLPENVFYNLGLDKLVPTSRGK